ncbi:MAG: lysophospholipid acyltransferase family protein [Calditrichaeota bacterium]|nr:lysophospholipid acyltransferase family protein [Calditrichota bacterium]
MTFSAQKMNVPTIGNNLPRLGNAFSRALGRLVLGIGGWRFEGAPPDESKFITIDAPHTSNWDAIWGISVLLAMGLKIHWMAKHTLFQNPLRRLLFWLGGVPIDRTKSHGVVDQMVDEFQKRDKFVIGITPEGTRKRVPTWKTGFYFMAMSAHVPIVMAFMDYHRKVLGFGPVLNPSGDLAADMKQFETFYAGITGKNPENYNPAIFRQEKSGNGDWIAQTGSTDKLQT